MLRFEREVVTALGSAPDPATRSAVEAFVDGSVRALPEFVRLGVLGESILLGTYVELLRKAGRVADEVDLRRLLDRWETSRISFLRQYVHLFRSMVLFGEHELGPDSQATGDGPDPGATSDGTGATDGTETGATGPDPGATEPSATGTGTGTGTKSQGTAA